MGIPGILSKMKMEDQKYKSLSTCSIFDNILPNLYFIENIYCGIYHSSKHGDK